MEPVTFSVNGNRVSVRADPDKPLLDILRNHLGLTGTKFGCGLEQCGYCLPGILISAKELLDRNPAPSRREIAEALDDNICRCGSHNRILRAVERATPLMRKGTAQ